jgi:Leucine-rich repeat (LRR) protein
MKLAGSIIICSILVLVAGCARQFSVTLNDQSLYDPRLEASSLPVSDADLQGCLNLALRQQGLQNPADLTALSCANANVLDLDGIAQYSNLRFLDLAGNRISNLQPLVSMNQLNGLSIPENPISDISILLVMRGLTAVILSGNNEIPCRQLDRLQAQIGENLTRPETCSQ